MIDKKIKKLINKFSKYDVDGYIIPKNDEFFSEYAAIDRLKIISNFDGSAGLAVILKNKNYLFVDGRYTIQAKIQSGKNFKVITIPEKFPKDILKTKIRIGFDPKLHCESYLNFLFNFKNIILQPINKNLIDAVWSNKPKNIVKPFFTLARKNVGQSFHIKINKVKNITWII